MRAALLLMALAGSWAEGSSHVWSVPGEIFEGAALRSSGALLTWGSDLLEWDLASGRHKTLAHGPFTSGGCWAGAALAVAEPSGQLALRRPPRWLPEHIDNGIVLGDCLWTKLLGHEGLLMIQDGAQVRLYERPGPTEASGPRWPYTEIYSIYTPSYQGGLILSDVDGDGLPDLFCGNYWIRSPESFELSWRLYAINVLHKSPRASNFRLVLTPDGLVGAQGDLDEPHVSLFTPPEDRKQEWNERRLAEGLHLRRPKAVAFDGRFLLVGENAGDGSRIFVLDRNSSWKAVELERTAGVHSAFAVSRGRFVAVGRDRIYRIEHGEEH